jgi:HEAT repeat protein
MKHMHINGISFGKWLGTSLGCALLCGALSPVLLAQVEPARPKSIDDAINEIKQGQVNPVALQRIARAGAVDAIPVLHQQFVRTEEGFLKEAIASALVRLGDKDRTYWDFLETHAREVIQTDAPFPVPFDTQGNTVKKQLSQEFLEWAKNNQVDPQAAATAQMQTVPAQISFLAATGDQRGLELLRRAMASRNYFVQAIAARGLAKLQDVDSVPLIITACKRAPAEAAALIARSLVFFNTSQAQSAAETFIKNREVLDELRKLSRDKGADALF